MSETIPKQARTIHAPDPLTGGHGRKSPPAEFGRVVASGWDTIQEAWPYHVGEDLASELEAYRREASAAKADGTGVVLMAHQVFGDAWLMHASGAKGGFRWRMESEDLILMLKGEGSDWGCSVRYLSHALWSRGWEALHDEAEAFITSHLTKSEVDNDIPVVTRADYAVDIHSETFAEEFTPERCVHSIVAHARAKRRIYAKVERSPSDREDVELIGRGVNVETVTIGKVDNLQVQLYKKTTEITEASNKYWMQEVWAVNADGEILDDDVWRVEVRMGKRFLKARRCRQYQLVMFGFERLVCAALQSYRLTDFSAEGETRHRPAHPLWKLAQSEIGIHPPVPIDNAARTRRDYLMEMLRKQLAGTLRSLAALDTGTCTEGDFDRLASDVSETMFGDREHTDKLEAAVHRYRFVNRHG